MPPDPVLAAGWMAQRGCAPFDFQREVWAAMAAGQGGLLHASTGSGKTYPVALGALLRAQALGVALQGRSAPPLGLLWVTPMRALAADTTRAWGPPPRWAVASSGQVKGSNAISNSARHSNSECRRCGAPVWGRRVAMGAARVRTLAR